MTLLNEFTVKSLSTSMAVVQNFGGCRQQVDDFLKFYLREGGRLPCPQNANHINVILFYLAQSTDPALNQPRIKMILLLRSKRFFQNIDTLESIVFNILKYQSPRVLKKLLHFQHLLCEEGVQMVAKLILNVEDWQDLLPPLEPQEYIDVPWNELTSYEKICFIAHEAHLQKELGHRIGLRGRLVIRWKDEAAMTFDRHVLMEPFEGTTVDNGMQMLKTSLTRFVAQYDGPARRVVGEVVDAIRNLATNHRNITHYDSRYQRGYIVRSGMPERHVYCALMSRARYFYTINTGIHCGSLPGVVLWEVPVKHIEGAMEYLLSHYSLTSVLQLNQVPSAYEMRSIAYFEMPGQFSGNCGYESPKAMFYACLIDALWQTAPLEQAHAMARNILKDFQSFDCLNSIPHYREHSLSPNEDVVKIARQILPLYASSRVVSDLRMSTDPIDTSKPQIQLQF